MIICKELQKIRESKKITRIEMAKKLSISPDTLKDIEYGKIRLSLENFLMICEFLEVSPMQLIKKSDDNYVILSKEDIEDLNRICNKINNQTNLINDNHGIINIKNGDN